MKSIEKLADHSHPLVQETAKRLAGAEESVRGKLKSLFHYMRDDIKFGFPKEWDFMKASQVIELGIGHCNTKSTLLLAFCKALGIPARVHYGLIRTEVMRKIFPGFALAMLPSKGSHSWLEVEVDGKWRRIDSYIVDKELFQASRQNLKSKGWDIGYALACPDGKCSCEFNIDAEEFAQMGAVVEDHGVWDDPSDYFTSGKYKSLNALYLFFYRLMVDSVNRKMEQMRKTGTEG